MSISHNKLPQNSQNNYSKWMFTYSVFRDTVMGIVWDRNMCTIRRLPSRSWQCMAGRISTARGDRKCCTYIVRAVGGGQILSHGRGLQSLLQEVALEMSFE